MSPFREVTNFGNCLAFFLQRSDCRPCRLSLVLAWFLASHAAWEFIGYLFPAGNGACDSGFKVLAEPEEFGTLAAFGVVFLMSSIGLVAHRRSAEWLILTALSWQVKTICQLEHTGTFSRGSSSALLIYTTNTGFKWNCILRPDPGNCFQWQTHS